MTCLLFISKMARKRYHDMDGEMQIELENKLFHKDIKECMCPTCERIGILWHDGNEILCKKCDKRQTLQRDQQNDQFFLKIARKVITEKTGVELANPIETNEKGKKKEEIKVPKLTYEEEEIEKLNDIIKQKNRENDYIRDHYKKELGKQKGDFTKQMTEIKTNSQKLNESLDQLKNEVSTKENRIQELNDTIAQQNQRIEELQQLNQDYYKIIEEIKIEEIIEKANKTENEDNKEETWSKDSKQNMTTEIPNVFEDLINLDF